MRCRSTARMASWNRAANISKLGYGIKRCALSSKAKTGTDHVYLPSSEEKTWSVPVFRLELVVHGFARRAIGREAALGVARALAAEQDGRAARAVLGMDDLRRLQQAEQGLDRRGRGELGREGFF